MKKFVSRSAVSNKKDEKISKLKAENERLQGQIDINIAKINNINAATVMASKKDLVQMYIEGKYKEVMNEAGEKVLLFEEKYYTKQADLQDFLEIAYIYGEYEKYPEVEILIIDEDE